ncbi:MAG: polyprenyl synthetase family protein [Oscillospiraceae bacterium]|nr:polyprenyl synthetase family protein [Oscillospiraceae bacterium]
MMTERYIDLICGRLTEIMEGCSRDMTDKAGCLAAMEYSLSAGGKRIRPVLTMMICGMFGGDEMSALDAACAVEMVHTFSLIHDDLPCMDDDDMRRGKPSCHIAHGEADALLAGDGLENLAYSVIAGCSLPDSVKVRLIMSLSCAVHEMICGQSIDLLDSADKETFIDDLYRFKTCALIRAACEMGYICSGRQGDEDTVRDYARHLGMAFQIVDDILDETADEKTLGKPVHSDVQNGKVTYISLYGRDRAEKMAELHTSQALAAAQRMPRNEQLCALTRELLKRDH